MTARETKMPVFLATERPGKPKTRPSNEFGRPDGENAGRDGKKRGGELPAGFLERPKPSGREFRPHPASPRYISPPCPLPSSLSTPAPPSSAWPWRATGEVAACAVGRAGALLRPGCWRWSARCWRRRGRGRRSRRHRRAARPGELHRPADRPRHRPRPAPGAGGAGDGDPFLPVLAASAGRVEGDA